MTTLGKYLDVSRKITQNGEDVQRHGERVQAALEEWRGKGIDPPVSYSELQGLKEVLDVVRKRLNMLAHGLEKNIPPESEDTSQS